MHDKIPMHIAPPIKNHAPYCSCFPTPAYPLPHCFSSHPPSLHFFEWLAPGCIPQRPYRCSVTCRLIQMQLNSPNPVQIASPSKCTSGPTCLHELQASWPKPLYQHSAAGYHFMIAHNEAHRFQCNVPRGAYLGHRSIGSLSTSMHPSSLTSLNPAHKSETQPKQHFLTTATAPKPHQFPQHNLKATNASTRVYNHLPASSGLYMDPSILADLQRSR